MNHSITLEQAKQMTARYRKEKENILSGEYKGKDILSLSETFDADSFRSVLSQEGCLRLRIYFGMDENLKIHLITVGVDQNGEMLEGENTILEEGVQCPPICPDPPPPPSLNYE